jgi:hypothetical protein
MEEQKEYQVATRETTPAMLLSLAIDKGSDLDRLERLMMLQEKYEANQARKAYTVAISDFKKNPPAIDKDKTVSYGNTHYNHASLANVTEKINAALSNHGLSASWTASQVGNNVTVTCRISHILGHYEETSLTAGPDTSGAKNAIQALGSAISYLQRYTLLSLTGLASKDMDTDAALAEFITDSQAKEILDVIDKKQIDAGKFLVFIGANVIGEILSTDFKKAMDALRAAKGQKKVQDAPDNT